MDLNRGGKSRPGFLKNNLSKKEDSKMSRKIVKIKKGGEQA